MGPVIRGLGGQDELVLVYENGRLVKDYTLAAIRDRAELPIVLKAKS